MRLMPSPLYGVHIKSGLITGFFSVTVHACFPVDGVHFMMGNDVASGKVFLVPEAVGAFVAKVLTRGHSPEQTHTAHDLLLSVSDDRLPPACEAVVCPFQEPNTRLPASVVKCSTVARKNAGECTKRECHVNEGVLLPRWVSQPGAVSGVTQVCFVSK